MFSLLILRTYSVDWAENGIDPELECHDLYLTSFKNKMFEMMKASIDQDLAKDPNGGKGRKKTVQVSWLEHKVQHKTVYLRKEYI